MFEDKIRLKNGQITLYILIASFRFWSYQWLCLTSIFCTLNRLQSGAINMLSLLIRSSRVLWQRQSQSLLKDTTASSISFDSKNMKAFILVILFTIQCLPLSHERDPLVIDGREVEDISEAPHMVYKEFNDQLKLSFMTCFLFFFCSFHSDV